MLAATTLLATLAAALSGLRVLLTGLLLSAALSALAALLAALVLLLIHEVTPWLVVVATDNAPAWRYVPHHRADTRFPVPFVCALHREQWEQIKQNATR
ncbi:MAG: hypothetical protein WA851_06830 [Xanthobacteraceae bacterium]